MHILANAVFAALVINLWPGVAPGSEGWTQKEHTYTNTPVGTVVMNVVTPTLTVYLPERSKTNGTAIVLAPGGSCVALAMSLEGTSVAQRLTQRGITVFLLKYRIPEKKQQGLGDVDMDAACKYGSADAIRAVSLVRSRAHEWNIAANRIGFLGFSAGGMVESAAVLQPDVAARPDFAAFVYGAPFGAALPPIPANLPPVFIAWAQDDTIAGTRVAQFYAAMHAAGNKPEAHVFASGGHGFGVKTQGTTSDRWIDEFFWWLGSKGYLER